MIQRGDHFAGARWKPLSGSSERRCLLRCKSPETAQSGHSTTEFRCPLLGVKRTWCELASMSANVPKASRRHDGAKYLASGGDFSHGCAQRAPLHDQPPQIDSITWRSVVLIASATTAPSSAMDGGRTARISPKPTERALGPRVTLSLAGAALR